MLVMHRFIPAGWYVCTYSLSARTGFNPILDTSRYSFLIYITLCPLLLLGLFFLLLLQSLLLINFLFDIPQHYNSTVQGTNNNVTLATAGVTQST